MERAREKREKDEDKEAKLEESFRYIPEEIVRNILPKTLGQSLLRFRCVSKQWRSWISKVNVTSQKVIFSTANGTKRNLFQIKTIDETTRVETREEYRLFHGAFAKVSILGSWNEQLLAISPFNGQFPNTANDFLYLWEPSKWEKRHERVIPLFKCGFRIGSNLHRDDLRASGLCFDFENRELKAVMVMYSLQTDSNLVFTVGLKSKIIKVIGFPYKFGFLDPPNHGFSLRSGPVVNNRLHWYIYDPSASQQHILYIHPNGAVIFVDLPLPDGNFSVIGLGALDGCLCMARRPRNGTYEDHVDVMGMREYGIKESWTVMFRMSRVDCYYDNLVPLFYTGEKDVVLMRQWNTIFAYNAKKGTKKDIGHAYSYDHVYPVVYEETLTRPV